jgi:hypothetical protein
MTETTHLPTRAFVCYRTEDTLPAADRLAVELRQTLDIDVFLDHRSLEGGEQWPNRLRQEVERADVVLILIGPRWLTLQTADGIRRLDDPEDWVRQEIEQALAAKRTIVPLLVDGASLIEARALRTVPQIQQLATVHALPLATKRWDSDLEVLVGLLMKHGFRRRQQTTDTSTNDDIRAVARLALSESLAMVFVDLMRLLYVASGGSARSVNENRYPVFVKMAERHYADLQGSVVQFASAIDSASHRTLVLLQRNCSFMLERLRGALIAADGLERSWSMMRRISIEIDKFCAADRPDAYNRLRDAIRGLLNDPAEHGRRIGELSVDEIWEHRLATQSRVLEQARNSGDVVPLSIAYDMDQRFGIPYFIIDKLLLDGMSIAG